MAAKSFFTGVLLKSFNFTPNKVLLNNSYKTPLINTTVLNLRSHAAAEQLKDLKIPDKPKKPLTPYLRFLETSRHSVSKQNPNLKHTEVVKKCAETWNSLSEEEKEKYKDTYKSDCEKYNQILLDYKKSLTLEQQTALEAAASEKKTMRERRRMKKLLKETNKPKRPMMPFTMYMLEQSKMRNMSLKELMSDPNFKSSWEALPEPDKKRYHDVYQKERAEYLRDLEEWEEKMIAMGHLKAVRTQTLRRLRLDLPEPARNYPKPKRPMSAFLVYLSEQQKLRKLPGKEMQRILKNEWAEMSESEKLKYHEACEKDKERYKADLVEWEKKMLDAGHPELIQSKTPHMNRVSRIKTVKNVKSQ